LNKTEIAMEETHVLNVQHVTKYVKVHWKIGDVIPFYGRWTYL